MLDGKKFMLNNEMLSKIPGGPIYNLKMIEVAYIQRKLSDNKIQPHHHAIKPI